VRSNLVRIMSVATRNRIAPARVHPKKDTVYEDDRPSFSEVEQLYIDPVECIDCGACVPACSVSAIFALE